MQPYHESSGLTEAQKATGRRTPLYILQFRYKGSATDYNSLKRELNKIGWAKINDLIGCYAKRIREDEDIDQEDVIKVLRQHMQPRHGADVSFGISKYIPPNERDKLVGISNLFVEEGIGNITFEE